MHSYLGCGLLRHMAWLRAAPFLSFVSVAATRCRLGCSHGRSILQFRVVLVASDSESPDAGSAGPILVLRWNGCFPMDDFPNNPTAWRPPSSTASLYRLTHTGPKSVLCPACPCCLPHGRRRLLDGHVSLARLTAVRPPIFQSWRPCTMKTKLHQQHDDGIR